MQTKELKSLVQQLSYSYSCVTKATRPFHLVFTGVKGAVERQFDQQSPARHRWKASFDQRPVGEAFRDARDKVVYLTADAEAVLEDVEEDKVYVIGGLVDRNRHKGLCLDRAVRDGFAAAKLPLADNVKLAASKVRRIGLTHTHIVFVP